MANVFISYTRSDSDAAKRVARDLHDLGHRCWLDEVLTGGQRWWDQILNNIRTAEIFLICVSPTSVKSEACQSELTYALAAGRHIVPVVVSSLSLSTLPQEIATRQVVDYAGLDPRSGLVELRKAIDSLAPLSPIPIPVPPAPPVPGAYMMSLGDRVNISRELTSIEQRQLLAELTSADARGGDDGERAAELLKVFRTRHDLNHVVASEIDGALAMKPSTDQATPPPPNPASMTVSQLETQRFANPPENVDGSGGSVGKVIAVIALIIVGLVGCTAMINEAEADCFVDDYEQWVCF